MFGCSVRKEGSEMLMFYRFLDENILLLCMIFFCTEIMKIIDFLTIDSRMMNMKRELKMKLERLHWLRDCIPEVMIINKQ